MTYRNRALLDLCHEAPCLLHLGALGCGEHASVPAHSDMIRHGRGEHHKSHDCFAVPSCPACHVLFTRANLGRDGYHAAWTEAMERYILWQWVSGKVRLADITQRPKESTMEAPHCKICDHNHWAREPHILPANAKGEVRSQWHTEKPKSRRPETPGAAAPKPAMNTRREGHRVLKAEAVRPDATRTAAKAKPNPPPAMPGKLSGRTGRKPAKPSLGKRKPGTKINKRKGKKKW